MPLYHTLLCLPGALRASYLNGMRLSIMAPDARAAYNIHIGLPGPRSDIIHMD